MGRKSIRGRSRCTCADGCALSGLDREAAKEALGTFRASKTLSANQIEFVNLIINQLTERGVMEAAALMIRFALQAPSCSSWSRGIGYLLLSKSSAGRSLRGARFLRSGLRIVTRCAPLKRCYRSSPRGLSRDEILVPIMRRAPCACEARGCQFAAERDVACCMLRSRSGARSRLPHDVRTDSWVPAQRLNVSQVSTRR